MQSANFRNQARLSRAQGANALTQGKFGLAAGVLGTAEKAASFAGGGG
jgi:hypothetical protein